MNFELAREYRATIWRTSRHPPNPGVKKDHVRKPERGARRACIRLVVVLMSAQGEEFTLTKLSDDELRTIFLMLGNVLYPRIAVA
jgi:hypothetical protein